MSSPLLWGPNGTASNLQSQILQSNGSLLQSNGPRNYINYNNFENQATTGWSLGTTGTLTNGIPTGTPTFGSGAAGTLSLAASTSSPIAGTASLSLVSSAATTAGNMFASDLLPIDTADQAKVLTYTFYYTVPTGVTNANFSGTSSNSYGIACYDVTNSSWLPVVGNFAMTQSTGVGIATGTMQTNVTTANVRFIVYCVNATAGAVTVNFDRFYLGPQTAPIGSVVTDWVPYTPTFTGFGTPTGVAFFSRRVGDSLEVNGFFQAGTTTATIAQVTLGYNGANANVFSSPSLTKTSGVIGSGQVSSAISASYFGGFDVIFSPGNNYVLFSVEASTGGLTTNGSNGSGVAASSAFMSFFATVPIAGWSSQVQMSSDTDTRVIAAKYTGGVAQATSTTQPYQYNTLAYDPCGCVTTGTSWKFTAPVSGIYEVLMSGNTGTTVNNYIYKNGVITPTLMGNFGSAANQVNAGSIQLSAGDYIDIRPSATSTPGATTEAFISIKRLSGPAVIAASETVAARVYGTSFTITGSDQVAVYPSRDFDTHNAYNTSTGVYTVPVSGKYRVSAYLLGPSSAHTTNQGLQISVYKNGSQVTYIGASLCQSAATFRPTPSGSGLLDCIAGDQLTIRMNDAAGTAIDQFGSSVNWASFERLK